MKKAILCAVLLVTVSACSHSDGKGMGETTNLDSNVIPTFKELSIDYGQAVAPEWVNELVVIKNTPQIDRVITHGSWNSDADAVDVQIVCKGFVPLKQEEYDAILQLVVDADLENYSPPEDCEELIGTTGITINFQKSDGIDHGFHTLCELEPEIDALVKGVSEYANELIPDCDRSMAEPVSEETTDEEQSSEE
jgi:hypothetical protein